MKTKATKPKVCKECADLRGKMEESERALEAFRQGYWEKEAQWKQEMASCAKTCKNAQAAINGAKRDTDELRKHLDEETLSHSETQDVLKATVAENRKMAADLTETKAAVENALIECGRVKAQCVALTKTLKTIEADYLQAMEENWALKAEAQKHLTPWWRKFWDKLRLAYSDPDRPR